MALLDLLSDVKRYPAECIVEVDGAAIEDLYPVLVEVEVDSNRSQWTVATLTFESRRMEDGTWLVSIRRHRSTRRSRWDQRRINNSDQRLNIHTTAPSTPHPRISARDLYLANSQRVCPNSLTARKHKNQASLFARNADNRVPYLLSPEPRMPSSDKTAVPNNISTKTHGRRSGLISRLLDNPQLPHYVASLPTASLHALIEHVGVDDAQELMVLATGEQMRELVDIAAWKNNTPGEAETFNPDELFHWIEVWQQIGPEFLTEKLIDLDEDTFVLALLQLVTVIDSETLSVSETGASFDHYVVFGRDPDKWPKIELALTLVYTENVEFLARILRRCCFEPGILAEGKGENDAGDVLHHDLAHEREARREELGFVTPLTASMFLSQAKMASLENLMLQVAYDETARAYFQHASKSADTTDAGEPPTDSLMLGQSDSDVDGPDDDGTTARENWQAITDALGEVEGKRRRPTRHLLDGPTRGSILSLKRALNELGAHNPGALDQRLAEIVFLSNVLVVGSSLQSGAFTEDEAAKAVLATCNLGYEYCLFEEPWDDETVVADSFLTTEPGLIRAFQIGYHLIGMLPGKTLAAVVRQLTTPGTQRRLQGHPWVREQLAKAFGTSDYNAELNETSYESLRAIFDTMSLVFDNQLCQELRTLCDAWPCFPKALQPGAPQPTHVNTAMRYINTPGDLRTLLAFLEALRLS